MQDITDLIASGSAKIYIIISSMVCEVGEIMHLEITSSCKSSVEPNILLVDQTNIQISIELQIETGTLYLKDKDLTNCTKPAVVR